MAAAEKHCLLLHGFTGGPYEVAPLAEHLSKAGAICHVPELPGHDPELRTLGQVERSDWLHAVAAEAERLTKIHGPIDLVGFSLGGLLSAYIANRYPIRKLVLLNAAVYYPSPLRMMKFMMHRTASNDWSNWNVKMKKTPWKATLQFIALHRELRREIPQITVPTFIVQSEQDHIIHPRSAKFMYHRLRGDKELQYVPESRHLICWEPVAPQVFDSVERFLYKES